VVRLKSLLVAFEYHICGVVKHGSARVLRLRSVDEASRTATFVASTGALDSWDEILDQKTWRLERYRANPVVLFAHNDRDLPIGRTETIDLNSEGNLEFSMRFASAEANPKAEQVFQLVKEQMIGGASVGYVADKAERVTENGKTFRRMTGLELFEISIVPVPANPETLAKMRSRAAKANGDSLMNMTPEQVAQLLAILGPMLGLPGDATAEDVIAAAQAYVDEEAAEPVEPDATAAAEVAEASAAKSALLRETGASTVSEAITSLATYKKSHDDLVAERERVEGQKKALEVTERRSLTAELVKLCAETPATAWEGDKDGLPDGKTPKAHLATMPIADLRARAAAFRATPSKAQRTRATPTPSDTNGQLVTLASGRTVELSAREVALAKREGGVGVEAYATQKARMTPATA
jgi:HK97 family phage prohead protease